jgi:[ribosomal protein S5]-alanine N-acetyltransferase
VGQGVTPIETQRLVLRKLVPVDEEALAAVLSDAAAMRWYPAPLTREQVRDWIQRQRERYPNGSGLMGVVEKQTGRLIGDCGTVWQEVDGRPELEVGYHVNRAHWNRGFATEAAKATIEYAFNRPGVDHVISLIRPENVQSRRVAEKNGLMLNRLTFWCGYNHYVYELWKK